MQALFQKQFEGLVWSSILSNDNRLLILDVRNEAKQSIKHYQLGLEDFSEVDISFQQIPWWSTMEAFDRYLYISEYQSQNNPNSKKYFKVNSDKKVEILQSEIPFIKKEIVNPSVYEPGTEYFTTVRNFLGLDLPCACEYLEIDRKIILSYYLRSGKELERYLLVLEDGKKIVKELQDTEMKGFASGAFFVVNGRLIFIKNRNEIFVYGI